MIWDMHTVPSLHCHQSVQQQCCHPQCCHHTVLQQPQCLAAEAGYHPHHVPDSVYSCTQRSSRFITFNATLVLPAQYTRHWLQYVISATTWSAKGKSAQTAKGWYQCQWYWECVSCMHNKVVLHTAKHCILCLPDGWLVGWLVGLGLTAF